MGILELLKRAFSTCRRIEKHKIPKWVRIKLRHRYYVREGNKEYKLKIIKIPLKHQGFQVMDEGGYYLVRTIIRYYYRNL